MKRTPHVRNFYAEALVYTLLAACGKLECRNDAVDMK
jgi:hypothetical protein